MRVGRNSSKLPIIKFYFYSIQFPSVIKCNFEPIVFDVQINDGYLPTRIIFLPHDHRVNSVSRSGVHN